MKPKGIELKTVRDLEEFARQVREKKGDVKLEGFRVCLDKISNQWTLILL